MKALPFTYVVKGRYWYFRHQKVGQVRLVGSPESPVFMRQYRKWLSRAGHTLKSAGVANRMRRGGDLGPVFQVYFAQAGEGGPIKIGSALDVQARVRLLQTGSPAPLLLLAVIDGGAAEERRLQREFADCHLRGEWFKPAERLLAFIGNIPGTEIRMLTVGGQGANNGVDP